ncbi:MAG: hypothetical protein QXU32_11380 [Nitrososphaerales archaeon]
MDNKEIEVLNKIFSMAARDPEFRNKLFTEPASVLDKHELSDRARGIIIYTIRGMLTSN